MNYDIKYTDVNKTPITVEQGGIDTTTTDLAFPGRIKTEYGEQVNENLLRLLEKFACPQTGTSTSYYPAEPDLDETQDELLKNPVKGQLWYNSTQERPFIWVGDEWVPIGLRGDYAANWGQIAHGQYLPRPESEVSGYLFPYSECIFSVSPAYVTGKVNYLKCTVDSSGLVTMQMRFVGSGTLYNGIANYLIVGIRGNEKYGSVIDPT